MKKLLAFVLSIVLLLSLGATVSAQTASDGSFALCAVSANAAIIEPIRISYRSGQTVREALLASDYDFSGLEQGFIYAVEGVSANYTVFYDKNGYDLNVPASDIRAICIGVASQYSDSLIDLIEKAADYRQMGTVCRYPAAQQAYADALAAIRSGDAETADAALSMLVKAIDEYEAILGGEKYTLTVVAMQGTERLGAPSVTLTDAYGNVTSAQASTLSVIAGEYRFCVSDGGYNRTEGTITIRADATLTVELPHGNWFGDVQLLSSSREAYPYRLDEAKHTATYQVPDIAGALSSVYLKAMQGDVPDAANTKLKTIYVGTNGLDYSAYNRSWESNATALTYLLCEGMEGAAFSLEAHYIGDDGYTRIQSYAMTIERTPTLASLSVNADGTRLPITFDPVTYAYSLVTVSDTIDISAEPYSSDYTISGTGSVPSSGNHTLTVTANGKTSTYTLQVEKKSAVSVTLRVPSGVGVVLENSAGCGISPINGVYRLIPGESYTYRATKNTYYHTEYTFTARDGMTIDVCAPECVDGLTALKLYNGSNATTRKEYESTTAFSPSAHQMVYSVSDCNTTLYIQATSDSNVTAHYNTQTTYAATNALEKRVNVTKSVDASGAANILAQAVAKSGYANTVTLRISSVSNGVTYYQEYFVTLARKLHLSSFSLRDQNDALTLLDENGKVTAFDRDRTAYSVCINRDETEVFLSSIFPNAMDTTDCCGGYWVQIGTTRYESLENTALALDPTLDTQNFTIRVCHADAKATPTDYTLTVQKTDPVKVEFRTNPDDAVVYLVNDQNGKRIFDTDGVFLLTPGATYSYNVTCSGYCAISGSYTAPQEDEVKTIVLEAAPENTELRDLSSYWPHLRQNSDNNGVISSPTPVSEEEAVLYWATKIGDGFDKNACGCPILVDGYLYTYSGSTIYKVDTLSGEIVATGSMDHASSFAINPPTYAEGMLFIGLSDGTVQAFNAATLESLWIYRDPLGGQPNCSITYHNGYVYTGFWVGETNAANFVCLSVTDEDPSSDCEAKTATWSYTSVGGFYWAGAYVCDSYLLVGTDDGASGYTSANARLLSFNPRNGQLLDEWKLDVTGDIRSSITAYNGKYYFTNKGGCFFEASVSTSGKIEKVRSLPLYNYASDASSPPMSTCTPTIYNGRAYIGVSGTSQFGAYSGHNITVIDIPNWEIAYTVRTQGYPQTSGVLTTAYQKQSGDVYVYFFDNFTPGKLRVLKDKPGQTSPSLVSVETYTDKGTQKTYETAYALFTPDGEQAQYALCSPIMDEYGTIYFKNDSAYLMALGSTIESLEIRSLPNRTTYRVGETFDADGLCVIAHYTNGAQRDVTRYLSWSTDALRAEDTDFVLTLPYVMYQNQEGKAGVEYPKPFTVLSLTIEASCALGDVTGDGTINMLDASEILKYVNGATILSEESLRVADVSGDGTVNMLDASLILQYVNGKLSAFPGEKSE